MGNLIKRLPLPIWASLFLYRLFNMYRLIVNRTDFECDISKQIKIFCPNVKEKSRLVRDVKMCYVRHLAKPQEYFLLGFKDKTNKERKEWITDYIKDTYLKKYAKIERGKELQDKFFVYAKMKPYFKREACIVFGQKDKQAYMAFAKQHNRFIAKPNAGSFGVDTKIWDMKVSNPDAVFSVLLASKCSWILEDLIEQAPEMSQFNLSSVNSVRVPTFLTKDGLKIFGTFMRVGRKGSVVDNAGAGGIFVRVDETTGQIISDGYTEQGEIYVQHPDSKVAFKGFQIPRWEELRTLAVQCHKEFYEHKYIGWDFALNDNGWVLLEGNWGQFLCQQVSGQKPMKREFISLITG